MPVVVTSRRRLVGVRAYEPFPATYVFDHIDSRRKGERVAVVGADGAGVVGGEFVSGNSTSGTLLSGVSLDPDYVGRHARGAVAVYLEDLRQKEISVCPDPLGGAVVYIYEGRKLAAASADLRRLVQVLGDLGISLSKSWRFGIELLACGNGGVSQSPYREIRALRPFEYCVLQRGKLRVSGYQTQEQLQSSRDYETSIEGARAQIEQNVRVATESAPALVTSHLTGGFDSRLVLAALSSSDMAHAARFYCQGDAVLPDRQIAERVASTFDLLMTEHPGTVQAVAPSDIGGQLAWPLAHSNGVLTIGPHAGSRDGGHNRILSGGYGGTFRSTYDYRLQGKPRGNARPGLELARGLWPSYLFGDSERSGLLSTEFLESFSDGIESVRRRGRALGVRDDALADFLYISTRSRYFIGHISRSWSQFTPRFDPLYSLEAVALALQLPLDMRSSNIIGFDLMRALDSRLLSMPFDVPKFSSDLARWRELVPESPWPRGESLVTRYDGRRPAKPESFDTGILNIPKPTSEDVERARQMNARAYQVSGRRAVQRELQELVLGLPKGARNFAFNARRLNALLTQPANRRVQVRALFNLFGVLTWYHGAQN